MNKRKNKDKIEYTVELVERHIMEPTKDWMNQLKAVPYGTKTLGKQKGAMRAALIFLHTLNYKRFTEKDRKKDTSFALHSETLALSQQVALKTWKKVRKAIDDAGVIEWDKRHKKSKVGKGTCMKYCFSEKWQDVEMERSASPYTIGFVTWGDSKPHSLDRSSLAKEDAKRRLYIRHEKEVKKGKIWSASKLATLELAIENYDTRHSIGRTGRLTCMANRCHSEVRGALLIDGLPTIELDVANCQPLLLYTLYRSHCEESQRWKIRAESGKVYELFMGELGIDRDSVKKLMFPFLYGSIGAEPEIEKVMTKHFPTLLQLINAEKAKHYKALCYGMQKKEAKVIVGLMSNHKTIPAITVHDAVYVKFSDADEAEKIIREEFECLYGVTPLITREVAPPIDDSEDLAA